MTRTAILVLAGLLLCGCFEKQKFADVPPDQEARRKQFDQVMRDLASLKKSDETGVAPFLSHADERVRRAAIQHLEAIATDREAAANTVAGMLTDKNDRVRSAAARALAGLDSPAGNAALVNALCDSDYNVRLYAWKSALRHLETVVPALVEVLQEKSPAHQIQCPSEGFKNNHTLFAEVRDKVEATGDRIVPALIGSFEKLNAEKQIVAMDMFGQLADKSTPALPLIISRVQAPDASVRLSAISTIGRIGDRHPDVVPTLLSSLKSPDADIARAARIALDAIAAADTSGKPEKRSAPRSGRNRSVPKAPRQ